MDYKEIAEQLRKLANGDTCDDCPAKDDLAFQAADAITELLARAEKVERERDELAARYISKEVCQTCKNYGRKDCDLDCLQCTAECQCNKCEEYSMWEWNEIKEEQSW